IDQITIAADGSLLLDAANPYTTRPYQGYSSINYLALDAPPSSLAALIDAWRTHKSTIDADTATKAAAEQTKRDEDKRRAEEKAAHDAPLVEALLAELEALDPLALLPAGVLCSTYQELQITGSEKYAETPEQQKRR